MRITFLGTSSGKASFKRFHSSLFLSVKNYNLLVDAGDSITRALLNNKINFNSIDGIILTHLHPDHYSGLAALIVQMKLLKRRTNLEIFIHESLLKSVKEFLFRSYLISERMKFKIKYKLFADNIRNKISEGFFFTAKENSHFRELKKYSKKYPDLVLYSASLLFEWNRKKIIYTSDISSVKDLFLFKEIHPEIFICEASHIPPHVLIKKINLINPESTYFTHYPDEDKKRLSEILANRAKKATCQIQLAVDNLSFEL